MRLIPLIESLLFAAAIAAAGPARAQPVPSLQPNALGSTLREADRRVGAAAYAIALNGRALCANEAFPLTGMLFHHLAEYEPSDRSLMVERYGLDRGPGVLTIIEGSPAARAGLVAGDVLLSVNGASFMTGAAVAREPDRKRWRSLAQDSEIQLEDQLRKGPARLTLLRGGREISLTLDSLAACQGRVRLARSKQVNAFADGRYVTMTTAMLAFLNSDDELAVVLGHELSHNILHHPALLDEQGVPKRGMMRSMGKNADRVWKTEEEADRLGIALMWAAGYNVEAAIPFWRRYLGKYDFFPQIFRTHPSLPVRERIARDAIAALPRRPAPVTR